MGSARDYYEILGLSRNADPAAIKKAYRRLALEYHPDRNTSPEATERFREIQEAYEVLSDSEKKALYDQFGHAGVKGRLRTEPGFGPIDDIFEGFQNIFDDFFGGRSRPSRGPDLRYRLKISFREAVLGCEKEIEVRRHKLCSSCNGSRCAPGTQAQRCPTCGGSGRLRRTQGFFVMAQDCPQCGGTGSFIPSPCPDCRGQGLMTEKAKIQVHIPEGVDTGIRLRVANEGEMSEPGLQRGDLYVEIEVEEDEAFERDGIHLYTTLHVPFTLAVFGGKLEIPLINGTEEIELKPFKESPFVLVLEGKGVKDLRTKKYGNLYVELHIEIPQKLSAKARQLLEDLRSELENPENTKKSKRKKKKSFLGFSL